MTRRCCVRAAAGWVFWLAPEDELEFAAEPSESSTVQSVTGALESGGSLGESVASTAESRPQALHSAVSKAGNSTKVLRSFILACFLGTLRFRCVALAF